ncbi:low molecular weight phosphatase family protein [Pseudochryseolinea flava]|uniref:Protein-tyrosine-phosphatase n=1 Tax=Pseudochryseolinea flava TaxID=2059302 RepID=A0A364Y7H2_9BACT|nr:protein-tyrosine-phosphatase [Pseudochryseolinea flava]RAW02084.1 protein-tyrosine-phosphatase [Pseudochryseolinea flava]
MSTRVLPAIERTIEKLVQEFDQISDERKSIIAHLHHFVSENKAAGKKILLNFICTHNSRRSHISQIWAQTAAHYYGIAGVETFSGGTEATAFNPRAVAAMKHAGFEITAAKDGDNPVYLVKFSDEAPALTVFSKRYDDDFNPKTGYGAVMTCSHADDNCPLIPGAKRIALTFDDPKEFDGTPQESAKYAERVHDIGREILFAFSLVK